MEVEPSVVEIGKSDIDIRCIVNGTNLKTIFNMQLKRSNKTVVVIEKKGVSWQDAALENKIEITVNASISNVMSSYLHLRILKTAVRYPDDMGLYQCCLAAADLRHGLITNYSQTVNLTGMKNFFFLILSKFRIKCRFYLTLVCIFFYVNKDE